MKNKKWFKLKCKSCHKEFYTNSNDICPYCDGYGILTDSKEVAR